MAIDRGGPRFRDDINGMRAIAVIGVVAYHFQLGAFRGGFVGVDVFFVISGFLMTQIISGRLEGGRFTFAEFYGSRVRRIVPAFVAVVLVVTLAGYFLMDPLQLAVLAQDAVGSLLFVSNFLYVKQGGYFAVATDQNWLLHTWSLSVEWQFYMLYPILLFVLHRCGVKPRAVAGVVAALVLLSFVKMMSGVRAGPGSLTLSFYIIDSRAWEFLVGALCASATPQLHASARLRLVTHLVGLVLIIAGMIVLESKTSIWPSALTTVPVAGAALMLLADLRSIGWARVVPVQRLGQWSYSVYLWHWPLAAMCSFFGVWSLPARLGGAVVSIALGFASYQLVERRLTDYLWARPSRLLRLGAPVFGVALGGAALALATNGLETIRFAFRPKILATLKDYRAAENDWMPTSDCGTYVKNAKGFALCRFGNPDARDTLVIGDSFAEQVMPRYRGAFQNGDVGITFAVRGGCVPMTGFERIPFGSNCNQWVDDVYKYAEAEPFKKVVFISFWFAYDRKKLCVLSVEACGAQLDDAGFWKELEAGYNRMADEWRKLKDQGKDVVVVEEAPFGEGDPTDLYRQALEGAPVETLNMPLSTFEAGKAKTTAILTAAARSAGITLVDPATALCPGGQCPFVIDGKTLYKDAFHLRASIMKDARFSIFDRYIMPGAVTPSAMN